MSTPDTTTPVPMHIAEAFLNEMVGRFDLGSTLWQSERISTDSDKKAKRFGDGTIVHWAEVTPRGQLAAIVADLHVEVAVFPSHVKGLYHASVGFSYNHHSRGSNGSDQRFIIATETTFGSKVEYRGCVSQSIYEDIERANYYHREELKAKAIKEDDKI